MWPGGVAAGPVGNQGSDDDKPRRYVKRQKTSAADFFAESECRGGRGGASGCDGRVDRVPRAPTDPVQDREGRHRVMNRAQRAVSQP